MKRSFLSHVGAKLAAVSALAIATAIPAVAQQGEPMIQRLETVQVSAQKRVQSLQEVPIAITAFSPEMIEALDIKGIDDVANYTPNFFISDSPLDPSDLRIAIRGIGNADPQVGLDTKTAVYLDGVYVGKGKGLVQDLTNLERVEVLRGPQGTLYGRNAVAGAVNLITKRPDTSLRSGQVTAQAGNFGFYELSGTANLPITDEWAVQVSGLTNKRDGWVENSGPGADFHGFENNSVSVDLLYEPTDFLSFNYAFDVTDTELEPQFWHPIASANEGPFAAALPAYNGNRQDNAQSFTPIGTTQSETLSHTFTVDWQYAEKHDLKFIAGYREADVQAFVNAFPETDMNVFTQVLQTPNPAFGGQSLSMLFGPTLAQTVAAGTGGQQQLRADYLQIMQNLDFDTFGASPPGGTTSLDDHQQFSFEMTLNGEFNKDWSYTGGVYYFNEETGEDGSGNIRDTIDYFSLFGLLQADIGGVNPVTGVASGTPDGLPDYSAALASAAFLGAQCAPPANAAVALQCQQQQANFVGNASFTATTVGNLRAISARTLRTETEAWAIYGQTTWDIRDDLRLTIGARLSAEEKTGEQQAYSPFTLDSNNLLGLAIPGLADTETFSSFDPAVILEHDLNDDWMVYLKYQEGFRSGGFNLVASQDSNFRFDKEKVSAIEFGSRNVFLDERLRLNFNAYYHMLDDEQVAVQPPGNIFARAIENVDSVYTGLEIDGAAILGNGFSTDFSYAYAKGDLDDVYNPFTMQNEARDEIGVVENSWAVALNYERDVDLGAVSGELNARVDWTHKDETFVLPNQPVGERDLLGAQVALNIDRREGPDFRIALWGRNLTDEEYRVNFGDLAVGARDIEVFGTPRTIGVSVTAKF